MIAPQDTNTTGMDRTDVWARLAAPVAPTSIAWRQDGRPVTRDGKHFARFVAYIEANTVRERLDAVVPGEWDLTLELLPMRTDAADAEDGFAFKARLQILGVIREDVGTGRDYKSAATDAFKRVAVRFGIGHEMYGFGQNWVQVDSDARHARPLEDPGVAHQRHTARRAAASFATPEAASDASDASEAPVVEGEDPFGDPDESSAQRSPLAILGGPSCPKCGGRMWDNRLTKRNPRAPDYKCRTQSCDGVIWPTPQRQQASIGESA